MTATISVTFSRHTIIMPFTDLSVSLCMIQFGDEYISSKLKDVEVQRKNKHTNAVSSFLL